MTERPGLIVFKATGKQAAKTFANESGGHRWQRIPPTEKRGRRQTSTITVAVMSIPKESELRINDKDLDYKTCRGSGAGGQHRNVTDSAVQLTHIPTGISVRCESERSQHFNRETALEMLRAQLMKSQRTKDSNSRAADRKSQIGSGMRADKRRTIRVQDASVTDHVLNKTWNLKDYLRGNW
ncbi:MAG: peptide chain release factor-like protein [Planctomycetota bacterium]